MIRLKVSHNQIKEEPKFVALRHFLEIAVANQLQYTSLSDYRVNYVPNLEYMVERGSFLSNMTLFDPSTRRLMRTGHFDLIIVEILYTEALLGLGQYFNAPVIAFSVLGMNKQVNDLVGNPAQPSYVPLAFNHRAVGLGSLNTILKRAYNLAMSIYEIFYINHVHHRLQVSVWGVCGYHNSLKISNYSVLIIGERFPGQTFVTMKCYFVFR